ncbi:magnesium-dependent phosphatase 1-like [Liolophura sinensis]|uniref:magnesium-dependent phosphatase 1-like n=1 Tax=Liolophura sinensis TaxID=3198878 RepID=UPI003158ABEF
MAKPKLIVFDLDYTLWPFWIDTHVDPPFKKKSDGRIHDRNGQRIKFYSCVPDILQRLQNEGYQLGVASRTGATAEANELLILFDWDKYFAYKEIYPGSKTTHFARFLKNSGLQYQDMLFFDDEHRNIIEVRNLGVTCILAEDGVTEEVIQRGFKQYAQDRNQNQSTSAL